MQDALAADAVGRRQLARAARGRGPGAAGGAARARSAPAHDAAGATEAEHERSRAPSRCRARMSALRGREARGSSRRSQPLQRAVGARHDPRRRALEEVQPPDLRLDLRARTGSPRRRCRSTATRSPSRSWSWSQRAEWKVVPSKRSRPGQVGDRRLAQRPGRRARARRAVELARARSRGASAARPRPSSRPSSSWPKRMCGMTPKRVGAAAQVVPDLGLRREGARPVGVGREGERVEVRGHVAGAAGIGVVAPRAADVVGALEHDEVLDAVLAAGGWPCRARRSRCRRWPPSRPVEHYSLGGNGTQPGRLVTPPRRVPPLSESSGAQRQTAYTVPLACCRCGGGKLMTLAVWWSP